MKNKFKTLQISKEHQAEITGGKIGGGGVVCTYQDMNSHELYDVWYPFESWASCDTATNCLGCS